MSSDRITKQIKFAVVMYGGGSLAIYINGVAQELLQMAKATSGHFHSDNPNADNPKDRSTSKIYRKIALILSDDNKFLLDDKERRLPKDEIKKAIEKKIKELDVEERSNPSVSFVIDVLTGSSAGGINAIYLSKALVGGASMDMLRDLWIKQGDFGLLLNDKRSVRDNALNSPREPKSLLNSQRMYLELLKALHGMEEQKTGEPLVDMLDLFVTFTDFQGVPLPISLSDGRILERRHKQVFNFRYDKDDDINDFVNENDPFLAFAARSTSAFPLAFEPMKLTDIDEIIKVSGLNYPNDSSSDKWDKYFQDVVDENGTPVEWKNRSLVDGGALDNKPFSYATDTLAQREAVGIVERKLLFIDPSPEEFKVQKTGDKPDAIKNLAAQGIGLPRYETIREDVERLIDRNALIERTNRLTAAAIKGAEEASKDDPDGSMAEARQRMITFNKNLKEKGQNWTGVGMRDVVRTRGLAFLPYFHLRISGVTDDISRLVTSFFKIDEDSDYARAIRCLIGGWREEHYTRNPEPNDESSETFLKFMADYDIDYRLRRLRFIMQKAEGLMREKDDLFEVLKDSLFFNVGKPLFEPKARPITKQIKVDLKIERVRLTLEAKTGVLRAEDVLLYSLPGEDKHESYEELKGDENALIDAVMFFQKGLNKIYSDLQRERHFLISGLKSAEFLIQRQEAIDKLEPGEERNRKTREIKRLETLRHSLGGLEKALAGLEPKEGAAGSGPWPTKPSLRALKMIYRQMQRDDKDNPLGNDEAIYCLKNLNKFFDNCGDFGGKLENSAKALRDYYNDEGFYLRKASKKLHDLLERENNPGEVAKNFVRNFLRSYLDLYESYDQISYPIFFGTSGGESVKVDVVRISSRDATSLINEGDKDEARRKLAGDYLFAFGAFLDPRWRQNDIMWGRLDGAERLIETLLPGEKYKNHRDILIEEANKIILNETLIKGVDKNLRISVVEALTYAGVETIDNQPTAISVSENLIRKDIEADVTKTLQKYLEPESLCETVKTCYEVDRELEPQATLRIISRATQIGGKILEDIANETTEAGGNRMRWIARLGSIFWGLVTVAAPNSITNLLFNYWLQLIYFFEVVLIVGATFLPNPAVQQFGMVALVLTIVLNLTVLTLHDQMKRRGSYLRLILVFFVVLAAIAAAAGVIFIYAFAFNSDFWGHLNHVREWLTKDDLDAYVKLFFIIMLGIFVMALFGWREARNTDIRPLGRIILVLALGMLITGITMGYLVYDLPGGLPPAFSSPGPIIALEFADPMRNELPAILGSDPKASAGWLKLALLIDSFIFIPLYTFIFLLLAQLLAFRYAGWFGTKTKFFVKKLSDEAEERRKDRKETVPKKKSPLWQFRRNAVWLGWIAVIIIVAAAAADGVENYFSYRILDVYPGDIPREWLDWKTNAATVKFYLIFTGVFILLFNLYRRTLKRWWIRPLFILSLLVPVIGIVLVTLARQFPDVLPGIGLVLIMFLVLIFVVAIIMNRLDEEFLKDF